MPTPPTLYNDNDPKVCAWLNELIAHNHLPYGTVLCKSIADINPADIPPTFHAFAGIGGWSYALQLAGWPVGQPVWTASCPCQPFSCAGRGAGVSDPRHLWPNFRCLVKICRPPIIFGEQVASVAGRLWLAGIRADLETLGYAFGTVGLCAYAVNAPHERLRSYWGAYSTINGCEGLQRSTQTQIPPHWPSQTLDPWHGTGSPFEHWRKLLAESHVCRMADGVSSTLDIRPRLHAYGNAIVPQVAAAFITAFMETIRGSAK